MRKTLSLAVAGLFILGLVLSGCGYLKKKEFERQFSAYKQEVAGNFTKVDEKFTALDQKVDQVAASAKEEAKKAKEEAIAAAEQGDADTLDAAIKKSEAGDKDVLAAAKRAAAEAEENAKKAAMAESKKSLEEALGTAKKAADESTLRANATAEKALEEAKKVGEALKAREAKAQVESIVVTVHFKLGATKLDDSDKQKLQEVADAVKKYPGSAVWVEGHTDATPVIRSPYRSNWELAEARANAVKDYLVKDLGLPTENIKAIARAHYHPIASQVTNQGRSENRRVEVKIIPPKGGAM